MGRILYYYIVKEQLVPLSICFFGLCFILVTGRMMQLMQYLFASNLSALDVLELFALAMPKLILYALPMATLIGVLLGFLRMMGDNEIIVMRAAGIKFSQFFPPVVTVLLVTTCICLYTSTLLMPVTSTLFRLKLKSLAKATLPALLKEGTFINVIPNMVFFFRNINPSDLSLNGIFVQDQREQNVQVAIVAERGRIQYKRGSDTLVFTIVDGVITRVKENLANAQTVSFKEYDLPVPLDELLQSVENKSKSKSEMSLAELRQKISEKTDDRLNQNRYIMEYQQRLALPMGCLLLGLLAAPLGVLFKQSNRMMGLILGIFLFLGYYVLLSAGKGLGETGILPPTLAIWLPNFLTLALAVYLWFKVQREMPIKIVAAIERRLSKLTRVVKHADQ